MKTRIKLIILVVLASLDTLAAAPAEPWKRESHGEVSYYIYVPASLQNRSLMINLHGCTQKASDLAELGNWEKAAEASSMIVVVPDVPRGGVMMGCWDYYGKNHDSSSRHHSAILSLTEKLIQDRSLRIDSRQVYVSGLSSGSAEAMLLGCMRPDLFAGMAMNSGPAIGTGQGDLFMPNTSPENVLQFCKQLAGSRETYFKTQLASVISGDQDFIVKPDHSVITTKALQELYSAKTVKETDVTLLPGSNPQGRSFIFLDMKAIPRVSHIVNQGLGHAWPSGKGEGRTERYINPQSVNYPAYLSQFFKDNNPRLRRRNRSGDEL